MKEDKIRQVSEHISSWLKDYAEKSFVNGYVIGVSGGVDSALTSTLCAMTGLKLLCIIMPINQHPDHTSRATEHIEWLQTKFNNVESITYDLTKTFDAFSEGLSNITTSTIYTPDQIDFGLANSRARMRMTALYFYAGLYKLLVAGTGNKVEDFGIGFFTKYGDGGVDVSPIGNLLKSEVYQLAKCLGVSESILNSAPTDGLFGDTRTDEDQIGATYDELEWAMTFTGNPDIGLSDRERHVLTIYKQRHDANLHKMAAIPVCSLEGIK